MLPFRTDFRTHAISRGKRFCLARLRNRARHLALVAFCNVNLEGEILWEKIITIVNTAWGSWKSPSMPYLKYTWEFVEVFSKKLIKAGDQTKTDIAGDEFKMGLCKVVYRPRTQHERINHRNVSKGISDQTYEALRYQDDIGVHDPFNGAGTTLFVPPKQAENTLGLTIQINGVKSAEETNQKYQ